MVYQPKDNKYARALYAIIVKSYGGTDVHENTLQRLSDVCRILREAGIIDGARLPTEI